MKKIFLIEDDPFLSSLLKNRLQKDGFEITLAKDGEEALNYLMNSKPDLILLDLILPKKTGFEVIEELKSNPQFQGVNSPIIVISNLGQQEDMTKCKQLGAVNYFVKAKVSIDELVENIKKFFENK